MKQTSEQEQIVSAASGMTTGQNIKIDAGAGTGKTQTLVMVSEAVVEPSLLLVFNKAAQLDANARFPRHVKCLTTHSMAYSSCGSKIAHKLTRPKGAYVNVAGTGAEIAKYFKINALRISEDKMLSAPFLGLLVRLAVTRFEQSADVEITRNLVHRIIKPIEVDHKCNLNDLTTDVIGYAKKLWKERIDINSQVLASHDTYLKMYQLSRPVLNYSVIYLDEAQDSNPCVVDIVSRQKAKIIIVGDKRQAIYGWRGAVNAMEALSGNTYQLTTSFRYGQKVADLANKILENTTRLKSFEGLYTEVGENVVDKDKPYVILYRTNAQLVLDAVDMIATGVVVNMEIDVRDFCNLVNSAVSLYQGDLTKVKHEEMLAFSDWTEFKIEAQDNFSYKRIQTWVEGGAYISILKILETHQNSQFPHVLFTTAHKSKGREFTQVVLANDYPSHINKEGEWVGLSIEDQNLLYVATTRAKKALNINSSIQELLNKQNLHKIFLTEISKLERDYCDNFLED